MTENDRYCLGHATLEVMPRWRHDLSHRRLQAAHAVRLHYDNCDDDGNNKGNDVSHVLSNILQI